MMSEENDTWPYIKFQDFENTPWQVGGATLAEYRVWLEEHAGPEQDTWCWYRGNRFAKGVYIENPEVAVLFKLKFGYEA